MSKNMKRKSGRKKRSARGVGTKNISIDLDVQDARLEKQGNDSLTWSVQSGPIPRFGRSGRFDNQIHNVIQLSNQTTVFTSSTSAGVGYGLAITAATHVPQFAQFAQVFDQYRIMEAECWIVPAFSAISTTNAGPEMYYVAVDYDSAAVPGSAAAVLQRQNCMVQPAGNGVYVKWRPHIAVAAYSGAFSSFKNERSGWIDSASNTVQHYGLVAFVDQAANSTYVVNFQLFTRVWVQFRNIF